MRKNDQDCAEAPLYDAEALPPPMPLWQAWCVYFGCLATLVFAYMPYLHGWYGLMPVVVAWFVIGAWLSRTVLPRVIVWHPVYATLGNIASEKVKLLLLWPLHYGILLLQLTIHRVL